MSISKIDNIIGRYNNVIKCLLIRNSITKKNFQKIVIATVCFLFFTIENAFPLEKDGSKPSSSKGAGEYSGGARKKILKIQKKKLIKKSVKKEKIDVKNLKGRKKESYSKEKTFIEVQRYETKLSIGKKKHIR